MCSARKRQRDLYGWARMNAEGRTEGMERLKTWAGRNRTRLWFCLLLNLLMLLFYLAVMRPEFDSNDDLNIALFVNLGRPVQDAHWLFSNWILGAVCAFLYRITNMIPWYGLMQYFGLFCAFTAVTWVIQRVFRSGAAVLLSMVILNFFASDAYITMQFTKTAGICAAAGLFLVVYAVIQEKVRILPLTAGILITAYGFMYRHLEADMMFALWAVFGLYLLLRLAEDAAGHVLKRAFRYIGLFALTLAVCVGCRLVDRYEYREAPEAAEYEKINDARSALTDYGFPKFEENTELFESLGITYNAYKLFSKWNFYDPDVFTLDKMEKLIEVQNRKKVSIETLRQFLDVYPAKWFENPMFYCFLALLVIVLLHGRREWKTFAEAGLLVLVLGALFYYMYLQGRFNLQRVDNPIWFCASLILLYLIPHRSFNLPLRYAWTFVLVILALNQNTWRQTWRHNTRQKAERMAASANFIAKVSSDTEHLYLTKAGLYAVSPGYGPLSLVPVGAASNMAVLGGWPAGSVPYTASLKNYGLTNPYRDCINNEKVYLIDNDINLTLNYLREYYDMNVQAVEAGKFDEENTMYQLVSDKASQPAETVPDQGN